jgi:hypothetical protein
MEGKTMGYVFRQSGRNVWMAKFHRDGQPIVLSTHTTQKREAERFLKLREAELVQGKRILPEAARYTVDDGMRDVLNDYVANAKRSHDHAERRWRLHLNARVRGTSHAERDHGRRACPHDGAY